MRLIAELHQFLTGSYIALPSCLTLKKVCSSKWETWVRWPNCRSESTKLHQNRTAVHKSTSSFCWSSSKERPDDVQTISVSPGPMLQRPRKVQKLQLPFTLHHDMDDGGWNTWHSGLLKMNFPCSCYPWKANPNKHICQMLQIHLKMLGLESIGNTYIAKKQQALKCRSWPHTSNGDCFSSYP